MIIKITKPAFEQHEYSNYPKSFHYFHLLTSFHYYSNLLAMLDTKIRWNKETDLNILSQLAIEAALTSNWPEAAKINSKILLIFKDNLEALNRLAFAQTCMGDVNKAQKTYKKVLELDQYNIIAKKNLEKIQKLENKHNSKSNGNAQTNQIHSQNFSSVFLYEPGKTKIINLLNLAPPTILASLNCGDKLEVNPKKHSICITLADGSYLGALPDDLSHRLLTYIEGGNKYEVYVKFATTKSLTVFIRETERSAKFINQPSFQENKKYEHDKDVSAFA